MLPTIMPSQGSLGTFSAAELARQSLDDDELAAVLRIPPWPSFGSISPFGATCIIGAQAELNITVR